jgi:hypothetical protein
MVSISLFFLPRQYISNYKPVLAQLQQALLLLQDPGIVPVNRRAQRRRRRDSNTFFFGIPGTEPIDKLPPILIVTNY